MKSKWQDCGNIPRDKKIKVLGRLDLEQRTLSEVIVKYDWNYYVFVDDVGDVVLPVAWKEI